jgi:poly-gamma-glutamate synthesis protein (capsule biosynthesis protein)
MAGKGTKVFLCGDVMIGRGVDQILPHPSEPAIHEPHLRDAREYVWLAEQANGEIRAPVDFSYIWGDALAELERRAPDVRVVNLETSITRNPNPWRNKDVHYRMHPANVACLADARVDVCGLANNHVLDYGRAGLLETLDVLRAAGIVTAGAGRNVEEAWQPAAIPLRHGGRVLVFSLASTSSGVPLEWAAAGLDHPGVALLEDFSNATASTVVQRICAARRPGDLVIASLHWGSNWGWEVAHDQVRFAHRLVDGGVDIVHGHSSHHPRPFEVYQGRLILYGCGDFINDYEGITGYEEFRDDLRLMYFATCDVTTGALTDLEVVPLQARRLQLQQPSQADRDWMRQTLERIGRPFGTRLEHVTNREVVVIVPRLRQALEVPPRSVKSAMSAPIEIIDANETVAAAAQRLRDTNVGILPVMDRGELAGVLTDRDVVVRVVAEGRDPAATRVRDVMTEGVATCQEDTVVSVAAAIMLRKAIRRLVVLDRAGKATGVISVDDLAMLGSEEPTAVVATSVAAYSLID